MQEVTVEGFTARMNTAADVAGRLTDRQKNCANLINDARFATQPEARLVLAVSAVETLCEQPLHCAQVVAVVSALIDALDRHQLDENDHNSLRGRLQDLKEFSVGQAYSAKFRQLGLLGELKDFRTLYDRRSNLVHDGIGTGDLGREASLALDLAAVVFAAELALT